MEHENDNTVWTVQDVAEYLRIEPSAVYSLTRKRGQLRSVIPLPCFRLHKKALRFFACAVKQWARQLAKNSGAA